MDSETKRYDDHLRPAWHVVVATLAALAATVVLGWLGH
jgi:hypothetical protein